MLAALLFCAFGFPAIAFMFNHWDFPHDSQKSISHEQYMKAFPARDHNEALAEYKRLSGKRG